MFKNTFILRGPLFSLFVFHFSFFTYFLTLKIIKNEKYKSPVRHFKHDNRAVFV
jgi:hypothetical protein